MNSGKVSDMKSLLDHIRSSSGISQAEAEKALGAVISFMASRLPSPVMGRVREALSHKHDTKELGNANE